MWWPSVPEAPGLNPAILLICSTHLHVQVALMGYCPVLGGATASQLDFSVTNVIVRSWLRLTATGSCPLSFFSSIAASS